MSRISRMKAVSLLALLGLGGIALSGCFGSDDEPQAVPVVQTEQQPTNTAQPPDTEQQEQPQQAPSEEQADEPEILASDDVYVVRAGDSLYEIAERLSVRVDDLIALNGIQNPDLLSVGQVLMIPLVEPSAESEGDEASDGEGDEEEIAVPLVTLPTDAVPDGTPTETSHVQFPQPGPEVTTDVIPAAPNSFLQYGAAALPWLHGMSEVEPIIDLFIAWPMPRLAVGNDRIQLFDSNQDGVSSLSIIYTDPATYGAALPDSNLVVYDPLPGDSSRYRIAYDHALSYAREIQGIQHLSDMDLTGDGPFDLTFREITDDGTQYVSSFYVLASTSDGYRAITSGEARVADVTAISVEDGNGDGQRDIVVEGLALDEQSPSRYRFVFTVLGDSLRELRNLRVEIVDGEGEGEGDSLSE